ncbi:hypothetical protein C8R43DRAFT_953493 [Mycena crocata]|nr:hypothetical protein C8R43DRAFT_953493 [Mycena crocata]
MSGGVTCEETKIFVIRLIVGSNMGARFAIALAASTVTKFRRAAARIMRVRGIARRGVAGIVLLVVFASVVSEVTAFKTLHLGHVYSWQRGGWISRSASATTGIFCKNARDKFVGVGGNVIADC